MELSSEFRRRIVDVFGAAGSAWLDGLPNLVRGCEERWRIHVEPPFPLSYNYVAPATREDGTSVVVKAGLPGDENAREIAALRHFGGNGSVRLIDADAALGVLLLERIEPGTTLVSLDDDDATTIAAGVMRALWKPPPVTHTFRTVEVVAAGLLGAGAHQLGPLPPHLVGAARASFAELVASSAAPVVLHGDLHHENILRSEGDRWVCIDPKGMIGEPAYETGALLRNPLPQVAYWPDLPQLLNRRIDVLADHLGFDRTRIRGWGMAQAVLSAFWSYEDHGRGWERTIAIAEALHARS